MSLNNQEKRNLIAQWAFDTRPILGRFHLWLDNVEIEWIKGENVKEFKEAGACGTAAIILHNRGDCYCWLNNLERGIEDFNQVLLLEPKRVTTLTIRGRAYLFTNQNANAMADFNRAIELDSNWFPAYYWRGRTYQKSGNNQAAEEDYTLVIERADYDEIRTVALESLESLRY